MSGLIEEMQFCWGQQFEELNHSERLWMIVKLAEDLCAEDENEISRTVEEGMERIDELNSQDKANLILALINQVINFRS